jgi:hypothetical protein
VSDIPSKVIDLTKLEEVVLPDNIDSILRKFQKRTNIHEDVLKMVHKKRKNKEVRPGYSDRYKYGKKNRKWATPAKRF